jgi:hypothetical protein
MSVSFFASSRKKPSLPTVVLFFTSALVNSEWRTRSHWKRCLRCLVVEALVRIVVGLLGVSLAAAIPRPQVTPQFRLIDLISDDQV